MRRGVYDVAGLRIAMNDPCSLRHLERLADVPSYLIASFQRHGPSLQPLVQRLPTQSINRKSVPS